MRSGRTGLFLFAMLLAPLPVAAEAGRDAALRALREEAGAIQSWVESAERPAWLEANPHEGARAAGEALGQQQGARLGDGLPPVSACRDLGQLCAAETTESTSRSSTALRHDTAGGQSSDREPDATALRAGDIRLTVLVSRSLGATQLSEIFTFAADTPGARVVFRGLAEDESLMDFVRQIHGLLAGLDPVPEVVLDPRPFTAAGVDIAPVLLAEGPEGELARVAGLADPLWLRARVLAGERGDLGVRGPVKAVTEPDLIAELKRRLAALDLQALREQALARFWGRVGFEDLAVAAESRTRTIDPTITAPREVRTADGTVLIRAGDTVNPLHRLPFTQRLVVFDASDARQVATARRLGREAGARRVTYLATRLERRLGWAGLTSVEDALDAPVYLLTPDVRARFALERVPAFVEAHGDLFRVAEVPPEAAP